MIYTQGVLGRFGSDANGDVRAISSGSGHSPSFATATRRERVRVIWKAG
jgi:hypothetical protein